MNNSLSAIVSAFHRLKEEQAELVLATLIETDGPSYRKAGAHMLIAPKGKYYGMPGSSEIHSKLSEYAQTVLQSQRAEVISYSPESETY